MSSKINGNTIFMKQKYKLCMICPGLYLNSAKCSHFTFVIVTVGYTAHWIWLYHVSSFSRIGDHQFIARSLLIYVLCSLVSWNRKFWLRKYEDNKKLYILCVDGEPVVVCVCAIYTLQAGRNERTVLCIAIEWNIVYFRHIKLVQFTYIGAYSNLQMCTRHRQLEGIIEPSLSHLLLCT